MVFVCAAQVNELTLNIMASQKNMFFRGLRFGLLLQFAVGPICLLVFNTAGNKGFAASSLAVLAITLVDGLYILLAGLGLAIFLQNTKVKKVVQFFGATVLILFGLDILLGACGLSDQPDVNLFQWGDGGVFFKAAVMTASNPLTIIFWSGVLSATLTAENIRVKQLLPFGLGCVCATAVFLHGVGLAGALAGAFLPLTFLQALNGCVGAVIICFGLRMLRVSRTQTTV